MTDASALVSKLWNYCNVLRDDGVSYGDYVEQLTYLLFLKMDDERSKPPYYKESQIPAAFNWESLRNKEGDELELHYRHLLEGLGKESGIIGVIFRKSQNKIQDPANYHTNQLLICCMLQARTGAAMSALMPTT